MKVGHLVFFFFFSTIVSAQLIKPLTLNDAVLLAIDQNLELLNADRDITIANKKVLESIAIGLPNISASGAYQDYIERPVTIIPAEFFGGKKGEYQEAVFGTKMSVNGSVRLDQIIFDGSYLVGVSSAKLYKIIYKIEKEKKKSDIISQTIMAYVNVLFAQENIKILKENIIAVENSVRETETMLENGLVEEENLEQLNITLLNQKASLLNSERLLSTNLKMLNFVIGNSIYDSLELTDSLDGILTKSILFDLMEQEFQVENTLDYQVQEINYKSKIKLHQYELSKSLPSIKAFVNANYNAYNDSFDFFERTQKWIPSSAYGLSLSIPIFSSFGRTAKVAQAKIEKQKAKTLLNMATEQLSMKYEQLKSDYIYAIETYSTSKDNLILAESIEEKNRIKYAEGIATSFDLRQAQLQLYNSQTQYLNTILKVINTKVELEKFINEE